MDRENLEKKISGLYIDMMWLSLATLSAIAISIISILRC